MPGQSESNASKFRPRARGARSGKAGIALAALALAPVASAAGPKWGLVLVGDCRDHALLTNSEVFATALEGQLGNDFLTPAQARQQLGPDAAASPQEIRRQLEPVFGLVGSFKLGPAEAQVRAAIAEIQRLPPGPERVALNVEAESLLAYVLTSSDREKLTDESFRRILRLAPKHQLSDEFFSPRLMARFNKFRSELKERAKSDLTIRSNQPGSEVFLDGVLVGKDPWSGKVEPGTYQLELRRGEALSLRHPIEVGKELTVNVDMAFESAIHPNRLPCVNVAGDEAAALSAANKLGTVLEVSEAAVLRLSRQQGEGWLSAMVISVPFGMKRREGALKLVDPTEPPPGIPQLAAFVVTGEPKVPVVARSAAVAPSAALALSERALSPAPPDTSWKRPVAYGLGGFGVLSVAAGAYFGVQGLSERAALNAQSPPSEAELPGWVQSWNQATVKAGVGLGAVGLGALALGTGAYLHFTDRSEPAGPSAALSVGPNGVQVFGQF